MPVFSLFPRFSQRLAGRLTLWRHGWDGLPANTRGALWMLAAALGFSTMATLVKQVGATLDSLQVVFFRSFFGLLALSPLLLRGGLRTSFVTRSPRLHLLRALAGVLAMNCMFYAIAHAPLADVTAISFAKPLFLIFLAMLFLGETIRWRRWSATAVGFAGVVIMVQPGASGFDPDLLVALAGTFFIAVAVTLIKKLSAEESTLAILAYFAVISTVLTLVPALLVWQWPAPEEWVLLGLIGVFGVAAQSCIVRAFRSGEATAVAPFDYTRLLFAGLYGYLLFDEVPGPWTLVGAGLIILATIYIARRETRLGRKMAPAPPPETESAVFSAAGEDLATNPGPAPGGGEGRLEELTLAKRT